MTRSTRAASALFGVAAILGACGSAGSSAPAGAAAPVVIDIQGFKFPPDVAKGTKVTWTNKDGTKHTVTSGTQANMDGKFDGQLDAGGTFSFTFTNAGTYPYVCTIHNSMTGTIVVK
jgi:plastocyanin